MMPPWLPLPVGWSVALTGFLAFGLSSPARLLRGAVLPRRGLMFAKIFFTAVSQPDPQLLRNFRLLFLSQGVVQRQCLFSFAPAGPIIVSIPVAASHPNAATHLLHQGFSFEGLIRGRHGDDVMNWSNLSHGSDDSLS